MTAFEQQKDSLDALFSDFIQRYPQTEMICLSTTDGFPVKVYCNPGIHVEADKISAASGTLFSISNAIAQQILSHPFRASFIESDGANIAFISIYGTDTDYVLCMSSPDSINIAHLRINITRLAESLSELLKK